jgi:hypothetical protein
MRIALVDDEVSQLHLLNDLLAYELNSLTCQTSNIIDTYPNGQAFLEN